MKSALEFRRILKGVVVASLLMSGVAGAKEGATSQSASPATLTWTGCGISKKAFMKEMALAYEKKAGIKIKLSGGGAAKGIRKVATMESDFGGSCRQTLENPRTLYPHPKERRVQMDPVAWDALVVLVHRDNPVNNITLDQIRKVYTGRITNWKQLGGRNAPIELWVRKGKFSGVGRTLRELVFYDYNKEFVATHVVKSSGPLEKAIQKDAVNAIAVSGISSAKRRKVKLLKLEGKAPTYENIKNGDYLLYRPLFLVTHLRSLGRPEIRQFNAFVHSEEGRQIMRNVGTVPYEDAIHLWLKYLTSVRKAQEAGLRQ